eukprot:5497867-Pleurochrysis_carterae.AAC.1
MLKTPRRVQTGGPTASPSLPLSDTRRRGARKNWSCPVAIHEHHSSEEDGLTESRRRRATGGEKQRRGGVKDGGDLCS